MITRKTPISMAMFNSYVQLPEGNIAIEHGPFINDNAITVEIVQLLVYQRIWRAGNDKVRVISCHCHTQLVLSCPIYPFGFVCKWCVPPTRHLSREDAD